MFTTTVEANINAPIETVFSYIRDFERTSEYNHSLKKSKWNSVDKPSREFFLDFSIINIHSDYKLIHIVSIGKIIAQFESSMQDNLDILVSILEKEQRNVLL